MEYGDKASWVEHAVTRKHDKELKEVLRLASNELRAAARQSMDPVVRAAIVKVEAAEDFIARLNDRGKGARHGAE